MSAEPEPLAASNPFATRWVRPGAIAFQFPSGDSPEQLLARLAEHRGWGEIRGPHGSGKSTLLATLVPLLEQAGRVVISIELHDGQRRLSRPLSELPIDARTTVIVDGYEQLSWWHAWRLRRHVRRGGGGLVVTTHEPSGLPTLFVTQPSLELAQRLSAELVSQHASGVTSTDVTQSYQATAGDLRELFFKLYDVHERRRGGGGVETRRGRLKHGEHGVHGDEERED